MPMECMECAQQHRFISNEKVVLTGSIDTESSYNNNNKTAQQQTE